MSLKFSVDAMLGKLAKYLRILGFDTVYIPGIKDGDLLELSEKEGRILVTRDHSLYHLAKHKLGVNKAILINEEYPLQQIQLLIRTLNITQKDIKPFSRCLICNEELVKVDIESVRQQLPEEIRNGLKEVYICPKCKKLYWQGSHVDRMKKNISKWFKEDLTIFTDDKQT